MRNRIVKFIRKEAYTDALFTNAEVVKAEKGSKETSMAFNITYNTCVIRKQQIMDKMGFDKKKTSLYDYVLSISQ